MGENFIKELQNGLQEEVLPLQEPQEVKNDEQMRNNSSAEVKIDGNLILKVIVGYDLKEILESQLRDSEPRKEENIR